MKNLYRSLLSILFPNRCPLCRTVLPSKQNLCDACFTKMSLLENPIRQEGEGSLDLFYSLYPYRHTFTKTVLFSMKNIGYDNSVAYAAERMARFVQKDAYLKNATAVTFCPRRPGERLRFGFDQAQLIAKALANHLSLPYVAALRRKAGGKRQRGTSGEKRQNNVKGRFIPRPQYELSGNIVILVDDVITTGATVRECASVLKLQMGAHKVYALSFTSPALKTEEE